MCLRVVVAPELPNECSDGPRVGKTPSHRCTRALTRATRADDEDAALREYLGGLGELSWDGVPTLYVRGTTAVINLDL